jgi:hypothetical protein
MVLVSLSWIDLMPLGQAPLVLNYSDAGLYLRLSLRPSVSWLAAMWAVVVFKR